VKAGVYVPNFGDYADPERLVSLAREAERAGWDGFFLYDHVADDAYGASPGDDVADPWILLAAIASETSRIRLGPLVTPVARRRPAKLAREIASLDRLSQGRLIFGAGLGAGKSYRRFGEDDDPAVRAGKLDEGLEVIAGLLRGEPFSFEGHHHVLRDARFLPVPVQPHVPFWIAGIWPFRRPFQRAARWDGAFPLGRDRPHLAPEALAEIGRFIAERRESDAPFDLIACGATRGPDESREPWARAGATWWLEWLEPERGGFAALRERVLAGPPR
jgi:alkanesulfonate monooxygenase SsuD/methylene tetrahydromethanopterin reductase-like flavin-dependent oxidoreductase (luciferase family)